MEAITSAIRRKYLDEVRICQDRAMDADITKLLFAAPLSYNTITMNSNIVIVSFSHNNPC